MVQDFLHQQYHHLFVSEAWQLQVRPELMDVQARKGRAQSGQVPLHRGIGHIPAHSFWERFAELYEAYAYRHI